MPVLFSQNTLPSRVPIRTPLQLHVYVHVYMYKAWQSHDHTHNIRTCTVHVQMYVHVHIHVHVHVYVYCTRTCKHHFRFDVCGSLECRCPAEGSECEGGDWTRPSPGPQQTLHMASCVSDIIHIHSPILKPAVEEVGVIQVPCTGPSRHARLEAGGMMIHCDGSCTLL